MSSSGYCLDEAVLAIQEAASDIVTVTKDIDDVKGKQEQLLQTINALSERISNIEQGAAQRVKERPTRPSIPLYERVSYHLWFCMQVELRGRLFRVSRALWPFGCQSGLALL